MTKHIYKTGTLRGIVVLGQYEGDIRDGLKEYKNLEKVLDDPEKWGYSTQKDLPRNIQVSLSITYEKSHINPEHILVSAVDSTGIISEYTLTEYLDDMLRITGIKEQPSQRKDFEAEPFKGWELIAAIIQTPPVFHRRV